MEFFFNPDELRVLGCLIEKRLSTPNQYPLTEKGLIAACNQSSNRDPVVSYDQPTVSGALKNTRIQGYSLLVSSADSRVPKFKENLCEKLGLSTPKAAIIAELLLRGPQTPGELRQRSSRMYEFADLQEVEDTLGNMVEQELVVQLPRQPGKREARYAHLLAGPVELVEGESETVVAPATTHALEERVAVLEGQLAEVLERLARLEGRDELG